MDRSCDLLLPLEGEGTTDEEGNIINDANEGVPEVPDPDTDGPGVMGGVFVSFNGTNTGV